jgi:Ferritin-like domain
MKIYFLAATLPTVFALQSGYLSQLNTGTYEGVNGGGKTAAFFPDPAETPKSIYGYSAAPPSAREVPNGSVSMLNKGTYEGINGVGFRAAFFPDPAETPKSIYGYSAPPPSAREVPDGVVSMLNRGTYEGINGGGYGAAFFPDPAIQRPPKELYSGAPLRRGGAYPVSRTTAMPPPVVSIEKPAAVLSPDVQDLYASGPAKRRAAAQPAATAVTPVASPELLQLWSSQVSVELAASQLYLSASIWFRARNMNGMAAWMLDESGEERGHGLAILEHAMKSRFPVQLKPLDAPKSDWQNPVQVSGQQLII